jgi:hypothetical protein
MRYMLLIYSREDDSITPSELQQVAQRHREVMEETARKGILRGAEPLAESATATTVRAQGDGVVLMDGPYAETKEQLAGYYILDCENLDEAIEWAAKIPTSCQGSPGCVEIRPMRQMGTLLQ